MIVVFLFSSHCQQDVHTISSYSSVFPEATSARLRLFIGCFKVFSSDKHSLSVFFPYSHYLKNNNKKKKKTASMDALTDYYGVYIQGI